MNTSERAIAIAKELRKLEASLVVELNGGPGVVGIRQERVKASKHPSTSEFEAQLRELDTIVAGARVGISCAAQQLEDLVANARPIEAPKAEKRRGRR